MSTLTLRSLELDGLRVLSNWAIEYCSAIEKARLEFDKVDRNHR